MAPVELGLASNPPDFSVQERLVYEPGDSTYEDPEEDEPEKNDPDIEEDPEEDEPEKMIQILRKILKRMNMKKMIQMNR